MYTILQVSADSVMNTLLNGVPANKFIPFFIAGLAGIFISFGITVYQAIKTDVNTAYKFNLGDLKFKLIRWSSSLLLLAVGIIFNKEILGAGLESASPIELTLWSSFLMGMGLDQLGKKLMGLKK